MASIRKLCFLRRLKLKHIVTTLFFHLESCLFAACGSMIYLVSIREYITVKELRSWVFINNSKKFEAVFKSVETKDIKFLGCRCTGFNNNPRGHLRKGIVTVACSGKIYFEISKAIFLREKTLDGYREALFKKLNILFTLKTSYPGFVFSIAFL